MAGEGVVNCFVYLGWLYYLCRLKMVCPFLSLEKLNDMRQIILGIMGLVAVVAAMSTMAQGQVAETYFPYPTPPDSMVLFQQRADYFTAHFWDRCDVKSAFSAREKMRVALEDFIQMLPNTTDTVALGAIDRFMHSLDKQPKDQVFIVEEAEAQLYSDTAQYLSDELYIAFARPMLENKKVGKEFKIYPGHLVRLLEGSAVGAKPPVLEYTTRDGERGSTANDFGQVTLYFFNDPDCGDCAITRARLMADIKTREMIEAGVLKVVSIYPGEYDAEWVEKVRSYPESWRVVAAADADDVYDLRFIPTFYLIYRNKIKGKGMGVTDVINVLNQL